MVPDPHLDPIRVLLVPGSLRAGSTNVAALATMRADAPAGVVADLYDGTRELPHFDPDLDATGTTPAPAVGALRDAVREADAVVFCTPEYAGALPGALKTLLEWLVGDAHDRSIAGKPVAWANVAGPAAPTGAADAHASLRTVLGYVDARIVEEACVRVPLTRGDVGEDGTVRSPDARPALGRALTAVAGAVRGSRTDQSSVDLRE